MAQDAGGGDSMMEYIASRKNRPTLRGVTPDTSDKGPGILRSLKRGGASSSDTRGGGGARSGSGGSDTSDSGGGILGYFRRKRASDKGSGR